MKRVTLYLSAVVLSAAMFWCLGCDLPGKVLCDETPLEEASASELFGRLAELGFEDLDGLFGDED